MDSELALKDIDSGSSPASLDLGTEGWRSSSLRPHRPGGARSTHLTSSRWSAPAPPSNAASSRSGMLAITQRQHSQDLHPFRLDHCVVVTGSFRFRSTALSMHLPHAPRPGEVTAVQRI